jgi:hypothetical protein
MQSFFNAKAHGLEAKLAPETKLTLWRSVLAWAKSSWRLRAFAPLR